MGGNIWNPIENFSGTLNGNDYKIRNFILSSTDSVTNFAFILVNDGMVENIIFEDFTFNASATRRADTNFSVVVAINNGTIRNCALTTGGIQYNIIMQQTNSSFRFGALVGLNNGTVQECYSTVDVTASSKGYISGRSTTYNTNYYTGGLVGENMGGNVSNCYYKANISMESCAQGWSGIYAVSWEYNYQNNYNYVGGLIGYQSEKAECAKSYADTQITFVTTTTWWGSYDHSVLLGYDYARIGGLVGGNSDNSSVLYSFSSGAFNRGSYNTNIMGGLVGENVGGARIQSCYSSVSISASKAGNVGGLVGENQSVIQDSYAKGNVSSSNKSNVGGFVGSNTSAGTLSKCYSTGNVVSEDGNADYFVGSNSGIVFKCYYLHGVTVMLGGKNLSHVTEYGSEKPYSELWSTDFLVDQLYWDEEGWIILFDEDPILDWESSLGHDYNLNVVEPTCEDFGYTIYVCRDCNRIFVRNFTQPFGHNFDYDNPYIVDPTCTAEGHTYYRCLNDGCEYLHEEDAPVPALGHKQSSIVDELNATCADAGYIIYHCDVCDNDYRVDFEPMGHDPEIKAGDEAIEPTCSSIWNDDHFDYNSTPGYTAKVTCSVCGETVKEREEIEPHSAYYTIDEEKSHKPTCTEDGIEYLICTRCNYETERTIPATGHTAIQGSARCATCGEYVVDDTTIIKIDSADALKAIADNLTGVYMLTADIDLAEVDWTPIGTELKPFYGMFFGNGYTIRNLHVSDSQLGGLFGCNNGSIIGLTVYNATFSVENIENAVIGVFAALNRGEITDCQLNGVVEMNATVTRTVDNFQSNFNALYNALGGFVGRNTVIGKISGGVLNAELNVQLTHSLKNIASVNLSFYLYRGWKQDFSTSVAAFAVGGIAGENNGIVENCKVSDSTINVRDTQITSIERSNKIFTYKAGKLAVEMNIYVGSIVGLNSGEVNACSGRAVLLERNGGTNDDSGMFFATVHTVNIYVFEKD